MTATNKTTWPEHTKTWQDWSLGFRSGVNFPVALCFIEWMYLPGQSVGFVVPLCNSAQCNSENSKFSTYRLTLERELVVEVVAGRLTLREGSYSPRNRESFKNIFKRP